MANCVHACRQAMVHSLLDHSCLQCKGNDDSVSRLRDVIVKAFSDSQAGIVKVGSIVRPGENWANNGRLRRSISRSPLQFRRPLSPMQHGHTTTAWNNVTIVGRRDCRRLFGAILPEPSVTDALSEERGKVAERFCQRVAIALQKDKFK